MRAVVGSGRGAAGPRAATKLRAIRQSRQPSRYALLFKALGDETRLEILALLGAAAGELCANEIEEHFDLSQPTISHHLKLLRGAGLIRSEKRGLWVHHTLEREVLRDAMADFESIVGPLGAPPVIKGRKPRTGTGRTS
ncbi:metalloregulator ArsR/SmtB family transcription factor [Myxococcota bacterium]|nr:metalloregulator ArsR/SmtB family transcription factor [Myxococcota bacterium]